MGKRKQASNFEHIHTYNPRAHESDDRRGERMHAMEVRRYQNAMEKQKASMRCYLPPEARNIPKIGTLFFS